MPAAVKNVAAAFESVVLIVAAQQTTAAFVAAPTK